MMMSFKRGDLVRVKKTLEDYVYDNLYDQKYLKNRRKIIISKGSVGVVVSKGKYASSVNFSNHRMKKSWNDMSRDDLNLWKIQNELTTIRVDNRDLEALYFIE